MQARIKESFSLEETRENSPIWHWVKKLEIFSSDPKLKQFNWLNLTFNINPWEVITLPICYGVKKGADPKIIIEVNGRELIFKDGENFFKTNNSCKDFIMKNIQHKIHV